MSRIRHLGDRIFERMLDECGIEAFNGAQGRILYVLWENGRMPISQIGKLTSLAKTTLTSMLDRMETAELVVRIPDERDRRRIYVELTPKAEALRQDYDDVSDRVNEWYFKGFTEQEIRQFEDTLRRIVANCEEEEAR